MNFRVGGLSLLFFYHATILWSATVTNSLTGLSAIIPDNAPGGTNISFVVTGLQLISDVDFSLDGTSCNTDETSSTVGLNHSYVGDLILSLISPEGTSVVLMNRPGGVANNGHNFCNTRLDDDGAFPSIQSIVPGDQPNTGTFRPLSPLSAFDGEDPNGTWILNVADQGNLDIGRLNSCSLILSSIDLFAVTNTLPSAASIGISNASPITITFDNTINTNTVTTNSFVVRGQQFGSHPGSISFPQPNQAVFTPSEDYLYGERLEVTLDSTIADGSATPLTPHVFSFDSQSKPAPRRMKSGPAFDFALQNNDLALGDLDGDGDLDAFLANGGSESNQVWINIGDGIFFPGPRLGANNSRAVALGDMDGDGDLDAFVGNFGQPNKLWLNDGSGAFTDSGQSLGSSLSGDVSLGDVDGDGDLDAFVANFQQANALWLNNGSGGLTDSGQPFTTNRHTTISLGDVDGDGDLDTFIGNSGEPNHVWLNNGSGLFTDSGQALGAAPTGEVSLGDVDGDGDLDAFVANNGNQANKVWLNNGSGAYTDSGQTLGALSSTDVSLQDLDGDGDLDAFVANFNQSNQLWYNDGSGAFSNSGQVMASTPSSAVSVGDLDGNGYVDAVVVNAGGQNNRVYLGAPFQVMTTSPSAADVRVGVSTTISILFDAPLDTNSVSTSNLVVRGQRFGSYPGVFSFPAADQLLFTPSVEFLHGEHLEVTLDASVLADGGAPLRPYVFTFKTETTFSEPRFVQGGQALGETGLSVALGDVDGDGDLDAVTSNFTQPNYIWYGSGSGGGRAFTQSPHDLGAGHSQDLKLGDLDGDGDLDAFLVFDGSPSLIWLYHGSGLFSHSGQYLTASASFGVDLGDLDGDGDLDAFIANRGPFGGGAPNTVWLNNGSGTFSDSGQNLGANTSYDVVLADIDKDGDLDAVIANSGEPNRVWINNGEGVFTDSGQTLGTRDSTAIALGDLDEDGDLDLVVANFSQPNTVWINNGDGNFFDSGQFLNSAPSEDVSLGDLDGDGDLDMYVANGLNQPDRIWINTQNGVFVDLGQNPGTSSGSAVALGDVDGDGDLDAFVVNSETNKVWFNDVFFVAESTPPAEMTAISNSAPITITFDASRGSLNMSTVTTSNFVVRGQQFGVYPGNISFPAANQAVFTPSVNYLYGEHLEISLSADIQNILNEQLVPQVFSVDVETLPRPASFYDSGQTLGSFDSSLLSVGDVDGDGDLDAIVANDAGEANTVWLNDGNGVYTNSGQTLGSSSSRSVVLGDVDGDGDFDAFVANYFNQPNTVWINNGSGNFADSGQTIGSNNSQSLALGDIDGDGDLDAVVMNDLQASELWLNDGTGVYSFQDTLGTSATRGVSLGDLDGDGDLDAFVANSLGQGNRVWLYSTKVGLFTSFGQSLGTSSSLSVSLGDLDGDGDLDAYVGNENQPNKVWLNNGKAVFTDSGQNLGSAASYANTLGDLDGDGDLDAFVGNFLQPNVYWLNDGIGGFTDSGQALGSSKSLGVSLDDLDGDGDLDAIVANYGEPNKVWLNQRFAVTSTFPQPEEMMPANTPITITFDAPVDPSTISSNTVVVRSHQTGPVSGLYSFPAPHQLRFTPSGTYPNGDRIDISLNKSIRNVAGVSLSPYRFEFRVGTQPSQGCFVDSGQRLATSSTYGLSLADLDGDGDLDTFVANRGEANKVWFNDGSGGFTNSGQTLGLSTSRNVSLGDVDGDGDLDAFVANEGAGNRVWTNDGNGGFTDSGQSLGAAASFNAILRDLDGDSDLDAFVANYGQANKVWINDGTGGFTDSGQSLETLNSYGLALGDVDADGDVDAFVANYAGQANKVWINDGTGGFADSGQTLGAWFSTAVSLGDVDGDGDLDALVSNYNQGNNVWLNNGSGMYTDSGQSLGTGTSIPNALEDLDGDGALDAFVGNANQANKIWLNDGTGTFYETPQELGSFASRGLDLGDVDGDGDLDAFVGNHSQANTVWTNSVCDVDVSIEKSSHPAELNVGSNILYTITVNNVGDTKTLDLLVTDHLPAHVIFDAVGSDAAVSNLGSGIITRQLSPLHPGTSTNFVISTYAQTGIPAAVTNTVILTTLGVADTNSANNEATAETQVPDTDSDTQPNFLDEDDDNDGISDLHEASADTDPYSSNSVLRIRSITGVNVEWQGGQAATQYLERSTAPDGPWLPIFTNPPPTVITPTHPLTPSDTNYFYRISTPQL